jgi:HK97 family phage portal protein
VQLLTRDGKQVEYRTAGPSGTLPWGNSVPPTNGQLGGTNTGQQVNEKRALQVTAVYGSVGIIADSTSTLPAKEYSGIGDPEDELVPLRAASPLVTEPYSEIDRMDFVCGFAASLALRGNWYGLIISRDPATLCATQIMPIHPDNVRVRRLTSGPNAGQVEYRFNGQVVPNRDVVHERNVMLPGHIEGLNPIACLRNELGKALAIDSYGAGWFANSAMPSGVIEVEGDLSPDETLDMAREWNAGHQGTAATALVGILTGGAKFSPISINPEDSQFLESAQYSAGVISGMIFRVPPHMIGIVDRTTSWGCLPGETLVFTTAGPKPIAEIAEGEEVWSLGERGMEPQKVVGKVATGYKPLITFETSARTIRATSNHHMLVRRYEGRADGRRKGECGWVDLLVDASDVQVGDYFMVPHGFADGDRTMAPNGRTLTVGLMELLGLYVGDGCRGGQHNNQVIICHGHDRDADHMEYYRQVIHDELGVRVHVDKSGTQTRFSSAEFVDLLETGFAGKALTKRVPGWMFRLTPELQRAFLRGYLDADGSVQRGKVIYSSANKPLLEDVRHLCIMLGVPVGRVCLGRLAGPMTIRGKTYQSGPKYQLSLSTPTDNTIGSNSPHKAERFVSMPHQRRSRYDQGWTGTDDNRQGAGFGWDKNGVILQRVTKITQGTVAVPVYDIEVRPSHTLVADGVLIGQTGIQQQEMGFVRNTLGKYIIRYERMISRLLPPGRYMRLDLSERLRGDTLQRYQAAALALGAGWLNKDEIRAEEHRPPIPGGLGQKYYESISMTPLGQMGIGGSPLAPGGPGGSPGLPSLFAPDAGASKSPSGE